MALRNVVKAPPQLVFRLHTEAEHLSAGGSTPPRDRLPAPAGQGRSCTRASPRTRPSTPTPLEPVDEGTLVRLRKGPLEANQVLPWSVLENAGAPVTVRGFGMLFGDRQPEGNKTEER